MTKPTRIAVIGAGHLGRIHARLASSLEQIDVVAVCDPSADARRWIDDELNLPTVDEYRSILDQVDAAIVAAPTAMHETICSELLQRQIHVLVEKPITMCSDSAHRLINHADQNELVLQVGHVERFNPAVQAVRDEIGRPLHIQATRTSGFTFRSTDVGVVLDLMIHDIDLVLSLVKSSVKEVRAAGASIFGPHEDVAHASLEFANGCVANLTASRASDNPERTMSIWSDTCHARLDMGNATVTTLVPDPHLADRSVDVLGLDGAQQSDFRDSLFTRWMKKEERTVERCNAILEEQKDFVAAIQQTKQPQVTGTDGARAVAVAEQVLRSIKACPWNQDAAVAAFPIESAQIPQLFASPNIGRQRKAG